MSLSIIGAPFAHLWRWLCQLSLRLSRRPERSLPPTGPERAPLRVIVSSSSALDAVSMFCELAGQPLLLDVSSASHVGLPFLRCLSASWPSQNGYVSRLGIRVSFERWARLRSAGQPFLRELASKGVQAALFHDLQRSSGWFVDGHVVHDAERVVDHLKRSAYDPAAWPRLLEAAASLIVHQPREGWAALYCDVAEIALLRAVPKFSIDFANEALQLFGRAPSSLECRALRILGEALYAVGEDRTAVHALQDAVSMATDTGCSDEARRAAHVLGKAALAAGRFQLAAYWLQRAAVIAGISPAAFLLQIRHTASTAPRIEEVPSASGEKGP